MNVSSVQFASQASRGRVLAPWRSRHITRYRDAGSAGKLSPNNEAGAIATRCRSPAATLMPDATAVGGEATNGGFHARWISCATCSSAGEVYTWRTHLLLVALALALALVLVSGCGRLDEPANRTGDGEALRTDHVYYSGIIRRLGDSVTAEQAKPIPMIWRRSIDSAGNVIDITVSVTGREGATRLEEVYSGLTTDSVEVEVFSDERQLTGVGSFTGDRWLQNEVEYSLVGETAAGTKFLVKVRTAVTDDGNRMTIAYEFGFPSGKGGTTYSGEYRRVDQSEYEEARKNLLGP